MWIPSFGSSSNQFILLQPMFDNMVPHPDFVTNKKEMYNNEFLKYI